MESCGCVNEIDSQSGLLHCVLKCEYHKSRNKQGSKGLKYYAKTKSIDKEGNLVKSKHLKEFYEGFDGSFEKAKPGSLALEVGCGTSPYIGELIKCGYYCEALDSEKWATDWVKQVYKIEVHTGNYPTPDIHGRRFDLILAAHVLEHFDNSPQAIVDTYNLLYLGGLFYIIIPDDRDKTNPDHYWFYNQDSLQMILEKNGFAVESMKQLPIGKREDFIYCKARKISVYDMNGGFSAY